MRTLLLLLGVLLLALSSPALAQDDAPIPYPDEGEEEEEAPTRRRKLPRRSEETELPREETLDEERERERPLAGSDDPNLGLAGEVISGALFPDSARGAFPTASFSFGLRFTWEAGRTVGAEWLRDSLFADVSWSWASIRQGTAEVYGDNNLHYFTVAPAWGFPFGEGKMFAAFVQGGFGLSYQATAITVKDARTELASSKPLFQYGIGLRATPTVNRELPLRISARAEITRFRRGYLDDTFVGGSVGVDF